MRLYAKLAVIIVLFLCLCRVSGEAARESAWEIWFAARCHAAYLLEDKRLEEQLVAEAGVVFGYTLEGQTKEHLADKGAPAPQVPPWKASGCDDLADDTMLAQSDGSRAFLVEMTLPTTH